MLWNLEALLMEPQKLGASTQATEKWCHDIPCLMIWRDWLMAPQEQSNALYKCISCFKTFSARILQILKIQFCGLLNNRFMQNECCNFGSETLCSHVKSSHMKWHGWCTGEHAEAGIFGVLRENVSFAYRLHTRLPSNTVDAAVWRILFLQLFGLFGCLGRFQEIGEVLLVK